MQNYLVGLDIGSKSIKAAVGEIRREGGPALLNLIKIPSVGVRKGHVDDISDLTQALAPVLGEIKKISKSAINNIFLGVGSNDAKIQPSIGVVAVSRADYEIYQDDIQRAIQSAQAINIAPNRVVLHSIIKEFIVDGVKDIKDPLGMIGNRLEVNTLIVDAFSPAVKNLTKCVEILGGNLGGLILGPIASARAVLTKNQRELGAVLIDIGFGKTSMCVYEEGKLLHAAIFPIGSGNITNDLAIGLKVAIETAETVKLSFGTALAREISTRDSVELAKIDGRTKGLASKKFIADIIEVRLAEIFELVNNELKDIGKSGRLPAGIVLVGGGAKLPGIVDLARQELKLSTQIGLPEASGFEIKEEDLAPKLEDPEFVSALGLLLCGSDKASEAKKLKMPFRGAWRRIFNYLSP
ncbi:MAG TPA: cell division protein FtsA [Candidatus Paceibacterota bacterium]